MKVTAWAVHFVALFNHQRPIHTNTFSLTNDALAFTGEQIFFDNSFCLCIGDWLLSTATAAMTAWKEARTRGLGTNVILSSLATRLQEEILYFTAKFTSQHWQASGSKRIVIIWQMLSSTETTKVLKENVLASRHDAKYFPGTFVFSKC